MDAPAEAQNPSTHDEEESNAPRGMSNALYSAYQNHRDAVRGDERDAAQSYDKWLLTLSGGALGLSMAFARDIAIPTGATAGGWLLAAWISLVTAIGAGLVCLFHSQRVHRVFRAILDDEADRVGRGCVAESGFWARVRGNSEARSSAAWVGRLNCISLISFLTGITLMAVFAFLTLADGELQMTEERRNIVEKPLSDRTTPPPPDRADKSTQPIPNSEGDRAISPDFGPVDQISDTQTTTPGGSK